MRSLLQTPWPGWKLNLQPYLEEEIREKRAGDSAAERQTPIERGDGPKKKNHDQEGCKEKTDLFKNVGIKN